MRPEAIVLAPEAPYPLAGGGALRTASLLHHLCRNYDVDLIVFRERSRPDPALDMPTGLVRRLTVIEIPAHRRNSAARAIRNSIRLVRRVPPLVDRFAGFDVQVQDALKGRQYQLGIVEHFWCAPYGELLSAHCSRTVLDLHNVESHLHQRCAAVEAGAAGLAHRVFRRASLQLEAQWLPRFSQVLTASAEDAKQARMIAPDARIAVYPNAIPATPAPRAGDEEAIVFSGNMGYHPNRTAVRFFRREIWPKLRAEWPRLTWLLVGKNPEAIAAFTSGDPRIEVRGAVKDAVIELARARVAVVPLLSGSGTRLKILEAWAASLPVVSTGIGAEGLPVSDGTHILLADSAPAFAAAVSRLLACSTLRADLGKAGRSLLEKEFTWETAWQKLDF